MIIKKNINNNVSLCLDSQKNEVVVFGKGVGFVKPGMEVPLSKIERTFYGLDNHYISMLSDISIDSLRIADKVLNYAVDKNICEFNGSLLFSLADHIDYAIERYKKDIKLSLPISNDIRHLFINEMKVGRYALKVINDYIGLLLPEEEATYIALNIINSEYNTLKNKTEINEHIIDEITHLIENKLKIKINRQSFNYSRFVTHMYYLFKRTEGNEKVSDANNKLYAAMIENYPEVFECIVDVCRYFQTQYHWQLSNDECLYLMLHVNRLREKESLS